MKKIAALGSLALVGAANAANFAASDSIATQLSNLTSDVNTSIMPAAIALVCGVAAVIAGRALIKKFFKI